VKRWISKMIYRGENGHTVWWLFLKYELEQMRAALAEQKDPTNG
jgi:hypothetical protein